MPPDDAHAQQLQREYYARTADAYDSTHLGEWGEHDMALAFTAGLIQSLGLRSVLDIGSGTGRALRTLKSLVPDVSIVGVEPSAALREAGYKNGLSAEELRDGDANQLTFADKEFDMVTEYGVLHHVPDPARVVGEMLRVARRAILISDSNNFGQGSAPSRLFKQTLHKAGLWKAFDRLRTRGKGYMESEADGIFYSYSVFDNLQQLKQGCTSTHLLSTVPSGGNLYRTASHVVIVGLKR